MGPGALPTQSDSDTSLTEALRSRGFYKVDADSEHVTVHYKLHPYGDRTQQFDFNNLPLSDFKRWLLYGGPRRSYAAGVQLIDVLRRTEIVAGRQLTQQEAEGVAYQVSRRTLYSFAGNFVGLGVGYAVAWRSREKMKFPFRAPQPIERYNNFPNRYIPFLKGDYARTAWHLTRANIWASLWVLLLSPVFSSMGAVAFATGLSQEQRTRELANTLEQYAKNRPIDMTRREEASQRAMRGTRNQGDQPPQASKDQPYPQTTSDSYDDQVSQEWERDTAKADFETGASRGTGDFRSTDPMPPSSRGRADAQSSDETTQSDQGVFFYDEDDASPTAGNRPRPVAQGGSTWARIRRGESSASSSQQTQQHDYSQESSSSSTSSPPRGWRRPEAPSQSDPQFQNSADSFSFSKTETDKQFVRDQAQKDFDDMVDRERKQSGSEDYDRGMKAVESGQENQATSGMSVWEQRRKRD